MGDELQHKFGGVLGYIVGEQCRHNVSAFQERMTATDFLPELVGCRSGEVQPLPSGGLLNQLVRLIPPASVHAELISDQFLAMVEGECPSQR